MAKCDHCGREMTDDKHNGCVMTHFLHDGKIYERITDMSTYYGIKPDRCHDCNAKVGYPHHHGCDSEKCPKCKGQFAFCECWGDEILLGTKKGLELYLIKQQKENQATPKPSLGNLVNNNQSKVPPRLTNTTDNKVGRSEQ